MGIYFPNTNHTIGLWIDNLYMYLTTQLSCIDLHGYLYFPNFTFIL